MISFTELLPESISNVGYLLGLISFFAGVFVIYIIDVFVPHTYEKEGCNSSKSLKRCALLAMVGIAIHNFPEGIAVFFSSLADIELGIAIMFAIALHNIPEGIAVAMPTLYASKSKKKALWYSFLAGIAEPIGALIAFAFLGAFIDNFILHLIIGGVAGVMVFICFDELLPQAYERGNSHSIIFGIFAGMAVMAFSLYLL